MKPRAGATAWPGAGRSSHARRLDDYATRIVDRAALQGLTPSDLRNTKLPWYSIANQDGGEAGEAGEATVYVYDEIGGTFGVSAKKFAEDLDEITAPVINVRINSPGGSLFDGRAIYNSLRAHPARIVSIVDSLAASIASIIAMAGDEIIMQDASEMMIHDALGIEMGNAADMRAMATFLDRESENLAGIYQRRAGGTINEWRERMLAESWMFGNEAVALGLADRVEERPAPEPKPEPDEDNDEDLDAELQDLMSRTFNLARFRYAGRDHAPPPARAHAPTNPPAQPQPDVAAIRQAMRGAFR